MNAVNQARKLYEDAGLDFDEVLSQHLTDGIVISSPRWFIMLRAIQLETGGLAWFIECGIGNLQQLANLVAIKLPFVAFCRVKNGKKTLKVYPSERLLRLAGREVSIP